MSKPSDTKCTVTFKPLFLDNWATVDFMPKYAGTDLLTSREKHFNSMIIG
jgi:hypothetical protein